MKLEITIERQDTFETLEEIKALPDGARIFDNVDEVWAKKRPDGILYYYGQDRELFTWNEMDDTWAPDYSFYYRIKLTDGNAELLFKLLKENHLDKWVIYY